LFYPVALLHGVVICIGFGRELNDDDDDDDDDTMMMTDDLYPLVA